MSIKDAELPQDGDIKTYFNLNLKMLSCIGIDIRLNGNPTVQKTKILKRIPVLLVIALEIYTTTCQVIIIGEAMKKHEFFLATQVTSHIFTNMLCTSKGCRLITVIPRLNTVLQELAIAWREYVPQHKIRDKVLKKAGSTLLLCKLFMAATCSVVMSFSWPALRKLILLYAHRNVANYTCDYSERLFFVKYPFQIDDPMTYFYVVLEEQYLILGAALFWISVDTLFAQLTTHASLHFEMLRHDVDSLINNENSDSDITLKKNLVTFIIRHKKILRICDRIEDIYSPVVLATVLMSSFNICFNIFELSETINTGQYADAPIHCFTLINTFLQILFYCVFAEILTEQSSAIGDAIYNSAWTDKDYKLRVYIQMIVIKCQNPFYCTAYRFFPIGHKRLTMVLNTAFSYYMMLRATT